MLHVARREPIPSEKALTRAAAPFATVIAARYLGICPLVQNRDRVRRLVRPHSKRGCPWFSRDASVQGATRSPICCTCHSLGLDFLEWNCAVVLFFVSKQFALQHRCLRQPFQNTSELLPTTQQLHDFLQIVFRSALWAPPICKQLFDRKAQKPPASGKPLHHVHGARALL